MPSSKGCSGALLMESLHLQVLLKGGAEMSPGAVPLELT